MPLKATGSPQLITLTQAKQIAKKLTDKGVPVNNIREISVADGVVSIEDPNYFSDGQPYQYIASIWGADEELGLVSAGLGNGGFNNFLKLAESGTYNDNPAQTWANAVSLILGLPGVQQALDNALRL